MPAIAGRSLVLIWVACAPASVTAWILYSRLFRHAPASDFMVFHTAARAVLEGNLPLLFDGQAFTAQMTARFAGLLDVPLALLPWVYPPLFLLIMTPFGLLPFAAACAGFLLTGFAALAAALRLFVRSKAEWAMGLGILLISPPAAFTVAVGQNAFLTTALMLGGFGLMRRAPVWAGVLLGVLTFKPQLWLLVPVALIAAREWRVFAAAAITASGFSLLSLAAFGIDPWLRWLSLVAGQDPHFQAWVMAGRMYGQSMFTEAAMLGASPSLASLVQDVSSVAAAAIVWVAFRRDALPADLKVAVLLAATLIAAPHVSNYDALMLIVAGLLLLLRSLREGFLAGELIVLIVTFGIELVDPPKVMQAGLLTPLVIAALIIALFRRGMTSLPEAAGGAYPVRPGVR